MKKRLQKLDPAPAHGQRSVLKPDANPALAGDGPDTLLCGECDAVVAADVWYSRLFDVCFRCPDCGAVSETMRRGRRRFVENVVFLPVGTYRLSSPLTVGANVPLCGEPRPGAGEPRSASPVTRLSPTWN